MKRTIRVNESVITPQDTYDKLVIEATDTRRKRSLSAIHEVCRLLSERAVSDFSYRTIVTLGKDRGLPIPGEKSIMNGTGAHYRQLIHAWRSTSDQSKVVVKISSHAWIEHIKDPVLRMSVALLAEELRAIRAKESRKSQQSGAPIMIGSMAGHILSPNIRLNDAEVAALKAAIDPATLQLIGLAIGSRGEVVDSTGRKVQKPGFRDAIEKVLSLSVKS